MHMGLCYLLFFAKLEITETTLAYVYFPGMRECELWRMARKNVLDLLSHAVIIALLISLLFDGKRVREEQVQINCSPVNFNALITVCLLLHTNRKPYTTCFIYVPYII